MRIPVRIGRRAGAISVKGGSGREWRVAWEVQPAPPEYGGRGEVAAGTEYRARRGGDLQPQGGGDQMGEEMAERAAVTGTVFVIAMLRAVGGETGRRMRRGLVHHEVKP